MKNEKNLIDMIRDIGFKEETIQHDGDDWSLFEYKDFRIAIAHDGNFTYAASLNGIPMSFHCKGGSEEVWIGRNYRIEKHERDFSNMTFSDLIYEISHLPHYGHCWSP